MARERAEALVTRAKSLLRETDELMERKPPENAGTPTPADEDERRAG